MVRLGIIGLGNITQGAHFSYMKNCTGIKLTAICDIDQNKLEKVGNDKGIDNAHRFVDYRDLIKCEDVDAVLVATPHHLHKEMAIAVCDAKKHLLLEKPVAMDAVEGEEIYQAFKKNGVKCMVCLSYHYYPCFRYAKSLMEQGVIGEVQDIYAQHFKESALWEGRRLEWRFRKELSGHGVLIDLGVHLIDLGQFLTGGIKSVCSTAKIAVKERKHLDSEEYGEVTVDDSCSFIAELKNGAQAVFTISRCAIGNANKVSIEIYGTKGVIRIDSNKSTELVINTDKPGKKDLGDRVVKVPEDYYYNQMQAFVNLIEGAPDKYTPTLEDGLITQKVIDAVWSSYENRRWEDVKE